MAEVTGSITSADGVKDISLNNAATEATLRLLLQSSLTANKQSIENIKNLAQKSGLDPAMVAQANSGLKNIGQSTIQTTSMFSILRAAGQETADEFNELDRAVSPMIGKFIQGTASVSDVSNAFGKLNPILGIVTGLFSRIVDFQQKNLESYQKLTNAGVNFGGSLTDLRTAAANSYLTLDQFTNLMSKNSANFVTLGGSVNEGAKSFAKFSHGVISSDLGNQLLAMGYTTEGVNESLSNYIAVTGVSSRSDLENSKKLQQSAGAYLDQLDRLADITGKSREEQEKQLKQSMFEADVQMTMSRMTKEDRDAFSAAMEEAGTLYGQAGRDIVLAQAQGRAVTGEAGQMLTATAGQAAGTIANLQNIAKQYGRDSKEFREASAKSQREAGDALDKIPLAAISTVDGFKKISDAEKTVATNRMAGLKTDADFAKRDADREKEKAARDSSQAAAMSEANKAMQEAGQAILGMFTPLIQLVTPAITAFANGIKDAVNWFTHLGTSSKMLVAALAGGLALLGVAKGASAAGGLLSAVTGGKLGAGGLGPLGSKTNPMHVIVVGGGLGGGIEDLLGGGPEGPGGKGGKGKAGKAGKAGKGALGKGLGAAKNIGKFIKGAGIAGSVIGALSLASDITDIEKEKKEGKITEQEARKKEGGAAGEVAGGAAGGWGGAAAGAALGTLIFPGVGTLIGGALGGIAGGFGGSALGKMGGEYLGGKVGEGSTPEAKKAEEARKAEEAKKTKEAEDKKRVEQSSAGKTSAEETLALNKTMTQMLAYLKDTAENTKRTHEATKDLNGNLFA